MSVVGPKDGSREAWDDYMARFKSDLDRKTLNDLQERVMMLEKIVAKLMRDNTAVYDDVITAWCDRQI